MMTLPYPPACPFKIQAMESVGVLPQEPVAYAMINPNSGKFVSLYVVNPHFAHRSMWVNGSGTVDFCVDIRHLSYNYLPATTYNHMYQYNQYNNTFHNVYQY